MRIQIQRIGHTNEEYHHHAVDVRLLEGFIKGGIRPGKELEVQFSHLDQGNLTTTKVVRVEYRSENMMLVHTKNSIYLIIKGWREN